MQRKRRWLAVACSVAGRLPDRFSAPIQPGLGVMLEHVRKREPFLFRRLGDRRGLGRRLRPRRRAATAREQGVGGRHYEQGEHRAE